jgi:hypothetical protein
MQKYTDRSRPSAYSGFFINWPVFSSRVGDFFCVLFSVAIGLTFVALMVAVWFNIIDSAWAAIFGGCHL